MKKLLPFLLVLLCANVFASHYRAGEITCEWVGPGLTNYKITVVTYTNTCNTQADDQSVMIYINLFDSVAAPRTNGNGNGVMIANCFKKNIYEAYYSFPGPGAYTVHIEQPNRKAGIVNMADPLDTPFWIETFLKVNTILGHNSTPVLLYPPLDSACVGQCFTHNPNAYDPDGDSLSFTLANSLGAGGQLPTGYYVPQGVTVNALTGDLTWCTPQSVANFYPQEYNLAMIIHEWRKDTITGMRYEIGHVERDLEVDVFNCNNSDPVVQANDTCVLSGNNLVMNVTATDPDNDMLTLSATGSPFTFNPAAVFTTPLQPQLPVATGIFTWSTICNEVRKSPYQVQFKAQDNSTPISLSGFKSVFITVIAPAPQNLSAVPGCDHITLSWNAEGCDPQNNPLLGYNVYRKSDCSNWNPSQCETGVPSYTGYVLIGTTAQLTYTDNAVSMGNNYSYRIAARYSDGAESYASSPVCVAPLQEVPVITNVDVVSTGLSDTINIRWLKPLAGVNGLDTIANPGPYEYRVFRAQGFSGTGSQVISFTANSYSSLNVTSYTDVALNTAGNPWYYQVHFYSNGNEICKATGASSVYLYAPVPNDNRLTLGWSSNVPWNNYSYDVYRKTPFAGYTYLGTTTATTFTDTGLVNGRNYCYKIKAYGQYSDPSLPAPLINWSEEQCGIPADHTPPCAPVLSVVSECESGLNNLSWNDPNLSCADDVVSYSLYYSPSPNGDFQLIAQVPSANITSFIHDSLTSVAGCYEIAAVDSFGNQSAFSNKECVDNCPVYELPNVFTPNGDNTNDLFVPFPYRYVKDIDLQIFNRWGELVFATKDPAVKWDGRDVQSGKLCSDGVYYFTCKVNEIRLEGIETRTIKGFVQILGAK